MARGQRLGFAVALGGTIAACVGPCSSPPGHDIEITINGDAVWTQNLGGALDYAFDTPPR